MLFHIFFVLTAPDVAIEAIATAAFVAIHGIIVKKPAIALLVFVEN